MSEFIYQTHKKEKKKKYYSTGMYVCLDVIGDSRDFVKTTIVKDQKQ